MNTIMLVAAFLKKKKNDVKKAHYASVSNKQYYALLLNDIMEHYQS